MLLDSNNFKLHIVHLQIFLVSCFLCHTNACLNITASLTQKIENPGFHKTINWLIDFSFEPHRVGLKDIKGDFAVHLKLPSGAYVDHDEIADMTRRGAMDARILGDVNVETPAHLSDEHEIFVYLPKTRGNFVSVQLPVHLRYQEATIGERYGKVILDKPSLLLHTDLESREVICGRYEKIWSICKDSREGCVWNNITYRALFDESILLVPVGNLEHHLFVTISTLLLGCIGCLYILSVLMTAKTKQG